MNIFIDARWVRTDYHDGISRYTAGVVSGFLDNKIPIKILIHDEAQLKLLPSGVDYIKVNYPISIKELFIGYKLNKLGADVVFSPLQTMGSIGRKYKLILTLQDIIYYRHPKPPTELPFFVRVIWRLFHLAKWPQRFILNQADYVSTVSNTSKKFIREFHLTDREIVVVYNASSIDNVGINDNRPREKSIVYIGSFMPYKNVEVLIKGMKYIDKNYTLHLVGRASDERKAELSKLIEPGTNVIFEGGANDVQIKKFLLSATCLATGSKEEGFGLPIVESQKYGTPVVCSDMEIFHEVAGDAALFFNSDSPTDFADKIKLLESKETYNKLIKLGHIQSDKFDWKKSALALYEVCKKLNNERD